MNVDEFNRRMHKQRLERYKAPPTAADGFFAGILVSAGFVVLGFVLSGWL